MGCCCGECDPSETDDLELADEAREEGRREGLKERDDFSKACWEGVRDAVREEARREGYAECQRDVAVKLRQLFDSPEAEWFIGQLGLDDDAHVRAAKGGEKGGAKERDAEAVLRDLVRAQDALLQAFRLGDNGASAADRCRELREELGRVDAKGGDRG